MKTMKLPMAAAALTTALLLTQIGCTESGEQTTAVENPAPAAAVPDGMVRGTVLETLDAGAYTYVFLETDQDKRWVAVPKSDVLVGNVVQTGQGMPMTDFESKTLNRTFDVVYFAGGLQNLSAQTANSDYALPSGHPATALPAGHPTTDSAAETTAPDIKVAKLTAGQNIAYVYANKDSLAGQPVSLRGKVVKYNGGILGTNFIHIQDGSGDVADGSNDLIVTSQGETAVGETIVVAGTIILDKDFGAGYSFPVLMDDASITTV